MVEFIKTQNSFARGEVSSDFFARDDISGLAKLENMDVISSGGLTRRRGLKNIATLDSQSRIIPFSVAENESYIMVVGTQNIYIMTGDGTLVQSLISPWAFADVDKLQYAQRFGTMIFVHPDYKPKVMSKKGNYFELENFDFESNDNTTLNVPFMKFDDALGVKITVTANAQGNNYATFATNLDFWTPDNVNQRILLMNLQWVITSYIDARTVVACTTSSYTLPSNPITDWYEEAFCKRRGWPCSIAFHQDRLVFGGSRSHPSGIWMSKVGKHRNFSAGTGLDDEAIYITLVSGQRQQICTVVSSDNLQILTSVGEWAISNKPLTPSSVDVKQHTSVGSVSSRYLPPQEIEGQTVFVSKNMCDIRQLVLDDMGEKYNADDLCALAKHLMNSPIDIAYNPSSKQLFVVMQDGTMSVLNQNSALGISAWGKYTTNGEFQSVAVVDNETFVVVKRENTYSLEKFDASVQDDNGADFNFWACGLPLRASGHNASRVRIRKIVARVLNTKSLFINNKRVILPNDVYEENSTGFDGDVEITQLGTSRECIKSPWIIHGSDSLPATVLSISMYGNYGI